MRIPVSVSKGSRTLIYYWSIYYTLGLRVRTISRSIWVRLTWLLAQMKAEELRSYPVYVLDRDINRNLPFTGEHIVCLLLTNVPGAWPWGSLRFEAKAAGSPFVHNQAWFPQVTTQWDGCFITHVRPFWWMLHSILYGIGPWDLRWVMILPEQ